MAWAGMGKARHAGPGGLGELRQSVKVGKLNLVDLAGSERVHITGATGPLHASPPPSPPFPPLSFVSLCLPFPPLSSLGWAQVKLEQMLRGYRSSSTCLLRIDGLPVQNSCCMTVASFLLQAYRALPTSSAFVRLSVDTSRLRKGDRGVCGDDLPLTPLLIQKQFLFRPYCTPEICATLSGSRLSCLTQCLPLPKADVLMLHLHATSICACRKCQVQVLIWLL